LKRKEINADSGPSGAAKSRGYSLQKFASVHASLHSHFSSERHLVDRQTYKQRRSAALAEWQSLAA
jgi:hypothetical protein